MLEAAADPALLADVASLTARAGADDDPARRAIYARAAIVIGLAAIEAVTNDALGAMHALIAAKAPAGRENEPPWRHFSGRSAKYLAKLLNRNKFASRLQHVLAQIARIEKKRIDDDLVRDMERLRAARNRVVHMPRQHLPRRHQALNDADEAARLAALAESCARRYADFVGGAFARFAPSLGSNHADTVPTGAARTPHPPQA
jgi:hypothetical protein